MDLDLSDFDGTDLGLEANRLRAGDPFATTAVAGLQFYAYGTHDPLVGEVIPARGDRLTLMRRADNPTDRHAVEVWWKNQHMLGHLPRDVAAQVAPLMDLGKSLRAYVVDPGDGATWSLRVVLIGPAAEPVHERDLRLAADHAASEVWPEEIVIDHYQTPLGLVDWRTYGVPAPRRPTSRQKLAAESFARRRSMAAKSRLAGAVAVLGPLLGDDTQPLPEGAAEAPDEAQRGHRFRWWDEVPPWLMTRTTMREFGLKPGGKPFATIGYGRSRREREYDLYAVAEAVPVRRQSPKALAATLERKVWAEYSPSSEAVDEGDGCWSFAT